MPRVAPGLLRRAHAVHPHLAQLLPICRDLPSASRELRWIREHVRKDAGHSSTAIQNYVLDSYILRRSRGEPLQYVLGSEYFGELEIRCRPGVLIPRPETAVSISCLVARLLSGQILPPQMRVLDLCTGTGAIILHFHNEFYNTMQARSSNHDRTILHLIGVDISSSAIALARDNQSRQLDALGETDSDDSHRYESLQALKFLKADVLNEAARSSDGSPPVLEALHQLNRSGRIGWPSCDILISNPPYISGTDYWRTTSPSVRKYEPRLALVPPMPDATPLSQNNGDLFYHRLLDIALQVDAKVVLFEVGDLAQAERVATMLTEQAIWTAVEIWRDVPTDQNFCKVSNVSGVNIYGSGNARSVLAYRGEGVKWLETGLKKHEC